MVDALCARKELEGNLKHENDVTGPSQNGGALYLDILAQLCHEPKTSSSAVAEPVFLSVPQAFTCQIDP